MEYKCTQCNQVLDEGAAVPVKEHDLPSYLMCPHCGSSELVDIDVAWAARELHQLRETLAEFAEKPNLSQMATHETFRKLARVAAENTGQVAEFLEEL